MHKYDSRNFLFLVILSYPSYPSRSIMSFLPPFRLPAALREHVIATGPSATPMQVSLDLRESLGSDGSPYGNAPDNAECLATLRNRGSFNWDRETGGFTLEWANFADFEMWRREEERIYSIELIKSTTRPPGRLYDRQQVYVCGRERSGGGTYTKQYPERQRKIESKKSGCGCRVVIKSYRHTPTILGCYIAEHDHEIGSANIAYTRLSGAAQERIKFMLTQKIDRYEIVSCRDSKNG